MKLYTKYLDKLENIENKIAIVTGANSGLGLETTIALVYKKVHVIMACRNLEKANKAKEHVLNIVEDAKIDIVKYDQGDFSSIEEFVNTIKSNYDHIDFLVCNAGVYYPKKDYKTKDGFELTLGTNYLGVFHLLELMKDKLEEWESRVVITTSLTGFLAQKVHSLPDTHKVSRNKIYAYSKYCLSRLCFELNSTSKKSKYYLTHPGVCQTNIISSEQTGIPNWFSKIGHEFLYLFTHSASQAALCNLVALTTDEQVRKYIKPRGLFNISGYPIKRKLPKYSNRPIIEETKNYLSSFNK